MQALNDFLVRSIAPFGVIRYRKRKRKKKE